MIPEFHDENEINAERILIALCQMVMLNEYGKNIQRADDFALVEFIAKYGKIPKGGDL